MSFQKLLKMICAKAGNWPVQSYCKNSNKCLHLISTWGKLQKLNKHLPLLSAPTIRGGRRDYSKNLELFESWLSEVIGCSLMLFGVILKFFVIC